MKVRLTTYIGFGDGRQFGPGDEVDDDDLQEKGLAARLVESGQAEEVESKKAKAEPPKAERATSSRRETATQAKPEER